MSRGTFTLVTAVAHFLLSKLNKITIVYANTVEVGENGWYLDYSESLG
jgi:hypothetical protein